MNIKGFRINLREVAMSRYAMNDGYAFTFGDTQRYSMSLQHLTNIYNDLRPSGVCKGTAIFQFFL